MTVEALRKQTGVIRVDAVDILDGVERANHVPDGYGGRQRHLHDDAADTRVSTGGVEPMGELQGRDAGWQLHELAVHPHTGGVPQDASGIDTRRRIVSDQVHVDARQGPALREDLREVLTHRCPDGIGYGRSLEDASRVLDGNHRHADSGARRLSDRT